MSTGESASDRETFDSLVRRAALGYRERGWYSTPLKPQSKTPTNESWTTQRIEAGEIDREFRDKRNLGLVLGEPSRGLADVDLDCAEARTLAAHILPRTGAMFGRASAPRSHWLYQCDPPDFRTTQLIDPSAPKEKAMLVELRGTGGQTMAPPSIHPDGEPVEWALEGAPAKISHEEQNRRSMDLSSRWRWHRPRWRFSRRSSGFAA
jgi:hypothetical protein